MYIPFSDDKHQMIRDSSKNALASADVIVTQLLRYHIPLLYFVCNHLIGVSATLHLNPLVELHHSHFLTGKNQGFCQLSNYLTSADITIAITNIISSYKNVN